MPMTPFFERFPEIAARETRVAFVMEDHESLPAGEYGFVEFFCNEVGCDCRRVMLLVVREDAKGRVLATISFGWEDPSFYDRWSLDPEIGEDLVGPFLDPLAVQSSHAPALLELSRLVVSDPAYVERLRRHYRMFREAIDRPEPKPKRPALPKKLPKRRKGR